MPNITIEKAATTTLSISIVQPICDEVDMQGWWSSVKNMEIKKLQKTIKNIATKPEWKTLDPFIPRSRFLKWRGEELQEGRIKAMMAVSNSHVEEMLKTFGKSGIIVDLTSKESDEAYDFARIRMQSDLKMLDVIKKIEGRAAA